MTKVEMEEFFKGKLDEDETFLGFFQATYMPSFWWFLLLGPLVALGTRLYFVGISSKGIHLQKLDMMGKMDIYNFFKNEEIADVKIGSGWLQIPVKLTFDNGRTLKLKAQKKGVEKIAKINDSMIAEMLKLQSHA